MSEPEPTGAKLAPSDSWKCYRCKIVSPSPGEGRPPVACLQELGGCGRTTDWDDPKGYTRFFPADWGDAKCDLHVETELRDELAPENMTLAKAISILKTVLDHPDPFFHASLILGAAQDHVIDLLHTVFYVIFSGGPDTGKGTANACAMALCRSGVVLGGASGPYLRDTLGGGGPSRSRSSRHS